MRELTLALAAILALLTAWVVTQRFRHPIDGQWTTGAVRDAVERLRDGRPLYAAPSAHYIALPLPPLYFAASAVIARFCSVFVACKVVSIAATVTAGFCIVRISRALGATPFWRDIALVLQLVSYSLTALVLDLESVEALYAALVLGGIAVLLAWRSAVSPLLAGTLLGLAAFTDLSGVLILGAVVVGLLFAAERTRALLVALGGGVVLVALGGAVDIASDGWFHYTCVKLPLAQVWRVGSAGRFFIVDVPAAFAIAAGSAAVTVPVLGSLLVRRRPSVPWPHTVIAVVITVAMGLALLSRSRPGERTSASMVWLLLGSAASAALAARAEAAADGTRAATLTSVLLLGGVSLQILGAMFDPRELAPNRADLGDHERFVQLVHDLETQGEVLATTTGGLTRASSMHAAALDELLGAGEPAPADLLLGLAQRRYSAIIVGRMNAADGASEELSSAIARNYFVAGRRQERNRTGTTGPDVRPRWLLRPRQQALPGALTLLELQQRQRIEQGFAQMKSATSPPDEEITPSDAIESLTAHELAPHEPARPE